MPHCCRHSQHARHFFASVFILQKEWSIFLDTSLFIVIWQQGTACTMLLYCDPCVLAKFQHRIDGEGVIKVADFGLTEGMHNSYYIRRRRSQSAQEKVPIRWMAPESIENCVYTEVTDVVSFFIILKSARVKILSLVGLWSDSVGDIHLWEGAICWNTCHVSSA